MHPGNQLDAISLRCMLFRSLMHGSIIMFMYLFIDGLIIVWFTTSYSMFHFKVRWEETGKGGGVG